MSADSERAPGLQPAALTKQAKQVDLVQSNYTRLGEHFRQLTPLDLQCQVFCGGKRCKYDSSERWNANDTAIDGIFSHWVTDDILAMARPNTDVMVKKDVVGQFIEKGIKTIINLQLPGEHATCGSPLHESGFSYDPNSFMEQGIFYYNFGLRDHSEPTLNAILDMVKVMAFARTEGKVAVHCHAGLGRTGVIIACYLVYALRARSNDVIRYIRMKRPQAVQTSSQIEVVQEFEAYILPQLYVYCNGDFMKEKRNPEFSLTQFLNRQKVILHGYEGRTLKNIPKIIYVICERLLKLCGSAGTTTPPHLLSPLEISYNVGTPSFTTYFVSAQFDHETMRVSYSGTASLDSPSMSSSLTSSRTEGNHYQMEDNNEFSIGDVSAPASAQYNQIRRHHDTPDVPSCVSGMPVQNIDTLLNDGITNQGLTDNLCYQELASTTDLKKLAEEKVDTVSAEQVYEALLVDHSIFSPEFKKQLKNYRLELNIRQSAWERLNTETNLCLLTGLLFCWLEHLRLPVMSVDTLSYIVLAANKPEVSLRKMDKEHRYTIEYIVRFVSRLQPLTREQQDHIILRFIASLSQQAVPVRETLLPAVLDYGVKRKQKDKKVSKSEIQPHLLGKLISMLDFLCFHIVKCNVYARARQNNGNAFKFLSISFQGDIFILS